MDKPTMAVLFGGVVPSLIIIAVVVLQRWKAPQLFKSWPVHAVLWVAVLTMLAYSFTYGNFMRLGTSMLHWNIIDYVVAFIIPTAAVGFVWWLRRDLHGQPLARNRMLRVWIFAMALGMVAVILYKPVHH